MSLASNLTAVVKKVVESADNVNSKMTLIVEQIQKPGAVQDDVKELLMSHINDLRGDCSTLAGMSNDLKTVLYPQSNEIQSGM